MFRICSEFSAIFRIFRICSEFSAMFRICSEFSAIFRIFWICSEFSVMFRIFSEKLVYSESLDFVVYELYSGFLIRSVNCLPFTGTWVHPVFLVRSVLLIFSVFCCCHIMCLYVLISVWWCRYDFREKMMFCSSLPPVVCRRAHVFFTLFVLCVSFSGLSIFDCPFGIL